MKATFTARNGAYRIDLSSQDIHDLEKGRRISGTMLYVQDNRVQHHTISVYTTSLEVLSNLESYYKIHHADSVSAGTTALVFFQNHHHDICIYKGMCIGIKKQLSKDRPDPFLIASYGKDKTVFLFHQ